MKYAKNKGRRLRWSKQVALLASITLVLTLTVGGALAYLTTKSEPVVNTFTPSKVDITVTEEFENNVKNNVCITLSEDSVKAQIRAMVVVTWQDKDGNIYPEKPVEKIGDADGDYTITWTKSGWSGPSGGWYTHGAIEPGHSTGVLFTACAPVADKTPDGYHLVVDVIAEAIQDGGGVRW